MVINDKLILVGGLEPWNFMTFHVLGMSSSQLTFIFFRGVGQPPTSIHPAHTRKSSERPTSNYKSLLFISAYQKGPTRTRVQKKTMPGACLNVCQDLVKGFASVGVEILSQ